jgi:hypothetical protein
MAPSAVPGLASYAINPEDPGGMQPGGDAVGRDVDQLDQEPQARCSAGSAHHRGVDEAAGDLALGLGRGRDGPARCQTNFGWKDLIDPIRWPTIRC